MGNSEPVVNNFVGILIDTLRLVVAQSVNMRRKPMDDEVKTRVPRGTKTALERIATDRGLSLSDILREAAWDYLLRRETVPRKTIARAKALAE
jgi:hypothetical protein